MRYGTSIPYAVLDARVKVEEARAGSAGMSLAVNRYSQYCNNVQNVRSIWYLGEQG
jgi:hypothetical protein